MRSTERWNTKCESRMQDLREGGTTLLFVSHSADTVLRMCQKAMWLDHGEAKMVGNVEIPQEAFMAVLSLEDE